LNQKLPTGLYVRLGYNEDEVNKYYQKVEKAQPLGGVIEPEQIAKTVTMITSSDLPSLTGQTIIVDGGRSQHPV